MISHKTKRIIKNTVYFLKAKKGNSFNSFDQEGVSCHHDIYNFICLNKQINPDIQYKALINMIYSYAEYIEHLDQFEYRVKYILYNHVLMMIEPEYYSVILVNLLNYLQNILGDVYTPDVMNAWMEAYAVLVNILMQCKLEIKQKNHYWSWKGFEEFEVVNKVKESETIISLYLEPKIYMGRINFLPGQYITLRFPSKEEGTIIKYYSLSNIPNHEYLRINVQKPATYAKKDNDNISRKIYHDLKKGDFIEVGPPCGDFFFDARKDRKEFLVFVVDGIGIFPVLSIILTIFTENMDGKVLLLYSTRHEYEQSFRSTIENVMERYKNFTCYHFYTKPASKGVSYNMGDNIIYGSITMDLIRSLSPRTSEFYICGPKLFMQEIYQGLSIWGVCRSQMHFEFF
ncbi:MAG: oxidoreductase FAD-binding domain protein [Candidatus Xenolissoclinum pacificiensis L6]|uniref:nitric oxide dioxygenase n=1 Tax=Candidatus Xenolissoclinum pacificiensis L6 TaxID=1401685 RepID=W2V1Q3_9RICK|nr:MAG: oxidoreductase FAD-binding domain protein [Candidatus Xenolissoclinum pacificiensis L6]